MTVASAAQEIVAACKLVHPNVTHHPCSDCRGTILVLRVAQEMSRDPGAEKRNRRQS